jgi:hypothetical protein
MPVVSPRSKLLLALVSHGFSPDEEPGDEEARQGDDAAMNTGIIQDILTIGE